MGKCAKTPTNYGSFLTSVSSNRGTGYFLPVVCRGASVLRSSLIVLLYSKWRVIWLSSEDGSFVVLLCDCGMEVVSILLMVAQTVKKVNRTGKDEVYHQVDIYGVGRRKNHVENSMSCCGLRHRKNHSSKKDYGVVVFFTLVGNRGFEPLTSSTSMTRSSQMS